MRINKDELNIIYQIEEELNATTKGNWIAHLPKSSSDDPTIYTEDDIYIAQTSYDTLSDTTKHNVIEDTIFIANSKEYISFLLKLVWKLNGNVIDPKTHNKIQKMIDSL